MTVVVGGLSLQSKIANSPLRAVSDSHRIGLKNVNDGAELYRYIIFTF